MKSTKKSEKCDRRFMDLCDHISQWTEDRDFQVGAVIVGPDLAIRSTGYNGFPRGVRDDVQDRYDRSSGEKFYWFEHGERNAIYNAARMGVSLSGCTLYVNRFPCADCARAIIQSGIETLCCPPKPANDGALDHSFDVSETMLAEVGLPVRFLTKD
jgi:dCMP deaminase